MAELDASVRPASYAEDRTAWWPHAGIVSWGAVFAGAVAAAAFGLILLTLGTGLGLAALSPWHSARETASRFGFAAIVWVCVTQVLTSGLGGYLAGRLRHRWPAVAMDEVYFRDTAHGFLTWAVATLATASLFAAMLPALGRTGVQAAASTGPTALALDRGDARAAENRWPLGYYVDSLFRPPSASPAASSAGGASIASAASIAAQPPAAPSAGASASDAGASAATTGPAGAATLASNAASGATSNAAMPASAAQAPNPTVNTATGAVVSPVVTPAVTATAATEPALSMSEPAAAGSPPKPEVTRIFLNCLATGDALSSADSEYVATLVARYTGLPPRAAQSRVSATYSQLQQKVAAMRDEAKTAADRARRASVSASLWLFVSLLMGAFAASFMAVFGGRVRDV